MIAEAKIDPADHIGLAWNSTIRWTRMWYGEELDLVDSDLISVAYQALVIAAQKYKPQKAKFSTFANKLIRNALWEWVTYKNRPIPCKYGVARHCIAIMKFRGEHHRDPTKDELASLIKRDIKKDETYKSYFDHLRLFQARTIGFSAFKRTGQEEASDDFIIEENRYSDRHWNGEPFQPSSSFYWDSREEPEMAGAGCE